MRNDKLLERYLRNDETTWDEVAERVADTIAEADETDAYRDEYYNLLKNKLFMPNSPTLMSAGTDQQYMSACLVLKPEDDMRSIAKTSSEVKMVTKYGAGVGLVLSDLRPKGDKISTTGGTSSGPVSFMRNYDVDIETIKQGGHRKGALMGVLHVSHPDIFRFIRCKGVLAKHHEEVIDGLPDGIPEEYEDAVRQQLLEKQLSNFNISVGVNSKFMHAVEHDLYWDLVNPRNEEVVDEVRARKIWNEITKYAHKNGEPGIVFLDKINEDHPFDVRIEGVNVCGEQPLLPYESCNLGAINLSEMLTGSGVDWEELRRVVFVGTQMLDNTIDLNEYPLPEVEKATKAKRKIGIGVMGWGEMLMRLGIPYDSKEARDLARDVSNFIRQNAIEKSERLAEKRGAFPDFEKSDIDTPRRNAVLTNAAPTGSRAQLADTTGGIEPLFSLQTFTHTDGEGNVTEFKYDYIEEAPEDARVAAMDIDPEDHIRMQAAWQENVGASISKTVNLPQDTTQEEVKELYKLAYELDCKGLTVYRNKSRSKQVLEVKNDDEEEGKVQQTKDEAPSKRFKMKTGCGTMYLIVVFDENREKVTELFTETKNGGCKASTEALSRMNSLALRGGVPIEDVIDQLMSVSPCVSYQVSRAKGEEVSPGSSCPHAVGLKLKEVIEGDVEIEEEFPMEVCPECGERKVRDEAGCPTCRSCGWSKCG